MSIRIHALHQRYDAMRERYCARRGGHDWTTWMESFRDSVAGGYISTRHRYCMRCFLSVNEDVDDDVPAPLPPKETT